MVSCLLEIDPVMFNFLRTENRISELFDKLWEEVINLWIILLPCTEGSSKSELFDMVVELTIENSWNLNLIVFDLPEDLHFKNLEQSQAEE